MEIGSMEIESIIESMEKSAVTNALKNNLMPSPTGEEWDAICAKYSEARSEKVDKVLSNVTLPNGWTRKLDEDDEYGRCTIIYDDTNTKVGSTFLKNTPYDYRGYTFFDADRLKELGISLNFSS